MSTSGMAMITHNAKDFWSVIDLLEECQKRRFGQSIIQLHDSSVDGQQALADSIRIKSCLDTDGFG